MGGVRYLYLTHNDVADHQSIMIILGDAITDEISAGTRNVEIQLAGSEPYQAPDLLIIPGPTKVHSFCSTKISFCSRAIISAGLIGLTSWWVSGCLLVFWPINRIYAPAG